MVDTEYYDILKIQKTATPVEIKKSYRRLALQYHPDKNDSPDAQDMFKKITEAYNVLMDVEKRALYDSKGKEGLKHHEETNSQRAEDVQVHGFMLSTKALFGDGAFEEYIGILTLYDIEGYELSKEMTDEKEKEAFLTKRDSERLEKIVLNMEQTIMNTSPHASVDKQEQEKIYNLLEIAGGPTILLKIAKVYLHVARKNSDTYGGLQSVAYMFKEKFDQSMLRAELGSSIYRTKKAAEQYEKDQYNESLKRQLENTSTAAVWKMGEIEIDKVLREACQRFLDMGSETNSSSNNKAKRCTLLEVKGEWLTNVAEEEKRKLNQIMREQNAAEQQRQYRQFQEQQELHQQQHGYQHPYGPSPAQQQQQQQPRTIPNQFQPYPPQSGGAPPPHHPQPPHPQPPHPQPQPHPYPPQSSQPPHRPQPHQPQPQQPQPQQPHAQPHYQPPTGRQQHQQYQHTVPPQPQPSPNAQRSNPPLQPGRVHPNQYLEIDPETLPFGFSIEKDAERRTLFTAPTGEISYKIPAGVKPKYKIESEPLPFGWSWGIDKTGQKFYCDPFCQITYKNPTTTISLPYGWKWARDISGRIYYVDMNGTTFWEAPLVSE